MGEGGRWASSAVPDLSEGSAAICPGRSTPHAESHGITRSRAAAIYLDIASETLRERGGIPGGRADEILDAFEGMRAALDVLGPPALGVLRLLAEEWEQATAEAERTRRELSQLAEEGTTAGD
jgi:hypothetical protein